MRIQLSKFGTVLSSRPSGREAYLAAYAYLLKNKNEKIELDFTGIKVLTPSWADEFIRPLKEKLSDRLTLLPSENPSVISSLRMIGLEIL